MAEFDFEPIKRSLVDKLYEELASTKPDNPNKELRDADVVRGYVSAIDTLAQELIDSDEPEYQRLGHALIGFAGRFRSRKR